MSDSTHKVPKVQEVWLLKRDIGLKEYEILQCTPEAYLLLSLEHYIRFWCRKSAFNSLAVGKIGHFEYQKGWFGRKKKIFVPEVME